MCAGFVPLEINVHVAHTAEQWITSDMKCTSLRIATAQPTVSPTQQFLLWMGANSFSNYYNISMKQQSQITMAVVRKVYTTNCNYRSVHWYGYEYIASHKNTCVWHVSRLGKQNSISPINKLMNEWWTKNYEHIELYSRTSDQKFKLRWFVTVTQLHNFLWFRQQSG